MASTAPRPPVTGATPPALFVHALSESLESLWPPLATQLGLQYIPVSTLGAVPAAAQGLVIVAAAGDESRLPDALRGAAGGNLPVVAGGVDEGRRTAIDALRAGADAFVSADFKYHEFFDAEGRLMIADVGHFESEQFTIELLYEIVREKFHTFALHCTGVNTNPVFYR